MGAPVRRMQRLRMQRNDASIPCGWPTVLGGGICTYERMISRRALVKYGATVATVAPWSLCLYPDAGFCAIFAFGDFSHAQAMASMRLFVEEVMPAVRR